MVFSGTVQFAGFALLIFLPAGTLNYWQAWVFLTVSLSTWIPGFYLLAKNPGALERRMRGGPAAETRAVQKLVMAAIWLSLVAGIVLSALDHRFGWSHVPDAVCVLGNLVVAAGLSVATLVLIQNNYAAATVRVEPGQQVVSTGLYRLVRHPMYTGNVILMVGVPLALGSYWGLVFVIPVLIVLTLRIRDEEKLLRLELAGYDEYTRKVRYRLLPHMW
ncbi:isoprenylcysteine carboxylmethyltransferase family protein [Mycobacterium vicinigordonae]|uniref:Isoprenylcysteine carboxylmethyltransferase family protein n=2 Tax=Mycobacterium vicinigordonae TaxID=1719132 RepID=A0A7D6HXG5_9MYCO|nr:isoprenylcysteine carboxylmethyltransferase family protein [Mycobacterium vicinigordonae]